MNELQRALIEKAGQKQRWEQSIDSTEAAVLLASADVMSADYLSETFLIPKNNDIKTCGEHRNQHLVLEAWDALGQSQRALPVLDPAPRRFTVSAQDWHDSGPRTANESCCVHASESVRPADRHCDISGDEKDSAS